MGMRTAERDALGETRLRRGLRGLGGSRAAGRVGGGRRTPRTGRWSDAGGACRESEAERCLEHDAASGSAVDADVQGPLKPDVPQETRLGAG